MIFDGAREDWEERPKCKRRWRYWLLRAVEWFLDMVGRGIGV